MGSLRLFAIGIDDVHSIMGASPELAARLRQSAETRFSIGTDAPQGMLGKLGPLFRKPHDPAAPRSDGPQPEDVSGLRAGRHVPPQRLRQAWTLLVFWLAELSAAGVEVDLSEPELAAFDFDLARVGVPARYGLGDLFQNSLGLTLLPCQGLAAGYVPYPQVQAMAANWSESLDQLEERHSDCARTVLGFLQRFPALVGDGPPPDLVAVYRS